MQAGFSRNLLPKVTMSSVLPALHPATLYDALWTRRSPTRDALLLIGGTLALALSAKIQVPFWPVPMTMQSMIVLLIGVTYGSRRAGATVAAYLAEGFVGLPVFAGPAAGPAYMMGPTGGYLLGFLLGAVAVGWLAERGWGRPVWRSAAALTLGHVALFVPGVLWLARFTGWSRAVDLGVTPFIAATFLKTALAVALVAALWRVVGERPAPRR
jgi:biotin transport system substrate-specific component